MVPVTGVKSIRLFLPNKKLFSKWSGLNDWMVFA